MTDDDRDNPETGGCAASTDTPATSTRRVHIETTHGDEETAQLLARAVRPDNTAAMHTRTEGTRLVTTIDRETTGGLLSTADDYIVNLQTGTAVAGDAIRGERNHNRHTSGDTSNRNTDAEPRSADTTTTTRDTETDNE